ncbi:MAG: response regulator [Steroidobacteraceae bacterium]|nr:response regulator [Steroidobacteraceae bacterium]
MAFGKLRLREILALLVLTITLPLGVFAGVLIFRSSHDQVAIIERRNVETARAVSVAVDQYVESVRGTLLAFAAVELFNEPDRAAFNEVALRLVPSQPGWYALLLVHPSGAVIADTSLGPEEAPAFTTAEWARTVFETQRFTVSNLFQDADGDSFFIVAVPVVRSGEVRYALAAQIRTSSLSAILTRQSVPTNGVIALVDNTGRVMARTRSEREYVGTLAKQDFQRMAIRVREGSWRSEMLDGLPSYAALSRSPITGWTVGIGLPATDIDGPIRRSMWALGLAGAFVLGVGVICALILSSFIVRALTASAAAARALARGEPVVPIRSRIVEADEMSTGLLEAAAILDARIRERDQALLAERVARSASEKDQARLAVTLHSIGDAVITTDPAGHITLLNPVAQTLTGWSEADAVGKPIEQVFHIVQEETRERASSPVDRVFRDGRVVGLANHAVLIARDGRETPIEDSAAPIRAADGTLIGIVLVFRDASQQRETERRRQMILQHEQEARREAEAVSRSKDEFVATVSHELRSPLNAIFGWVRLLRSGSLNEAQREHALEVVERNTRAQAQLIEDLLDMSRVVTGNLRLDMQRVDFASVVQTAVESVRPTAEAKQITLTLEVDPRVRTISGDPDRLQQVAWNLLTNSLKFTPASGRIDVSLIAEGAEAVLRVADTGIGISKEVLPHVFERFRQGTSSPSRAHGGLGIGLALVRHLAEVHGGTASAESEGEYRGSTFTVRIPMLSADAVSPVAVSPESIAGRIDGAAASALLANLSVLVVDDDADARELISTALRYAGATVMAASSVRGALELLDRHRPDALVSDIAMPNGTGYDLVQAVRKIPRVAQIPAIALNAYGRPEDRDRALTAGFNLHIVKPVEPRQLVSTVARVVGRA